MFNRKYTEEDMRKAIDHYITVAYQLGCQHTALAIQKALDACSTNTMLNPEPDTLALKQALVILQKKEEKGEGLV